MPKTTALLPCPHLFEVIEVQRVTLASGLLSRGLYRTASPWTSFICQFQPFGQQEIVVQAIS